MTKLGDRPGLSKLQDVRKIRLKKVKANRLVALAPQLGNGLKSGPLNLGFASEFIMTPLSVEFPLNSVLSAPRIPGF
jgi:hypothetical protein